MISDQSDKMLLFQRLFIFPLSRHKIHLFLFEVCPTKYAFCFDAFSVGFPILLKFPMSAKKPG